MIYLKSKNDQYITLKLVIVLTFLCNYDIIIKGNILTCDIMTMINQKYKNDSIILRTIDESVPKDYLVRKMDACMDFSFIEEEVKDLYSPIGRSSISPIILFKLLIINKTF